MRWLAALALVGCTTPTPTPTPPAVPPQVPGLEVTGVLIRTGSVRVGEATFDLTRPDEAADLGRVLASAAGGETLVLEGERGTPMQHVQRLIAVLEAVGIEDYRLDLGR